MQDKDVGLAAIEDYRMASTPVSLSDLEGHFCCVNLCNSHTARNLAYCLVYYTHLFILFIYLITKAKEPEGHLIRLQ